MTQAKGFETDMRTPVLTAALLTLILPAAGRAADMKTDMNRMAGEHKHDHPAPSAAATTAPAQEIAGEEVVYATVGGKPVKGFLARPKNAKGPLPGIIVIQEWWGLNDNIRQMAKRLAGEGYTALAVDLYGGKTAATPAEAQALMRASLEGIPALRDNLRQAHAYLETKQKSPRIGVIGWCYGGGWSLDTGIQLGDGIGATVLYYGHLDNDKSQLAKLKSPVLAFFGGKDDSIPAAGIKTFESLLKELGKPAEIHVYETADHAFANPSGGNYQEAAAKDSWQRTVAFFAKTLKK